MKIETILNQLLAARSQIDATIFLLEDLVNNDSKQKDEDNCKHPPEQRLNLTTMGGKEEWECLLCGYHYKAEQDKVEKNDQEEVED